MKFKLNNFVIWPLAFLLVFVPVFCCCFTSSGSRSGKAQAQAQAQERGVVANSHKCCDSQTKNDQPQHDSSKCDCPNHSLVKVTNIVFGSLESLFSQNQSSSYQVSFLALVLSTDNPRTVSTSQVVHSPPLHISNPLYIEFRTLRL